MPDGTIPDPRMNPLERRYGIINVSGILAYYDKESLKNKKRFMPAGFTVTVPDNSLVDTPTYAVYWNGIEIKKKCKITDKHVNVKEQAPMTAALYDFISKNLDKLIEANPDYSTEIKE